MEALLFLLNSIVVVAMVIMGLRDDRRRPGTPQTSVLRTFEDDAIHSDEAAEQARRDRIARSRVR